MEFLQQSLHSLSEIALGVTSNQQEEKERESGASYGRFLWARAQCGLSDLWPHTIDQNSVTQPHLTARENGTCGLAVGCGGKGNSLGSK